ncbi:hypothetical protein C8R45DRAFT_1104745 [Mycena sanguinolenta]|nr:hypothetical protein C8R45DRAFT_1104745 [Mycena sanguinolenta]
MSKADYESVKADFLKGLDTANSLAKFQAPLDARQKQLSDIGAAAVSDHRVYFLVEWLTRGETQAWLSALTSYFLEDGQDSFRQAIFSAHGLYHSYFNPDGVKGFSYPSGYDHIVHYTGLIQGDCSAKKAPATAAPSKAPSKPRRAVTRKSATVIEYSDEEVVITTAPTPAPVPEEMAVDDEGPKLLLEAKTPRMADALKATTSKRAQVDSNPPFHENAFLTAATAEFYTAPANIQTLVDEAESVVGVSTDFEDNPLTMRKRIYYIMVEMAFVHEQICSSLLRRAQLVTEGKVIQERLRALPASTATGLDAMVL